MIRRPPISTRTDTLFPYTTLFRALHVDDAHDPPLALDRHRNRAHFRRSRGARRVGGVGRAPPRDTFAQLDAAVDHRGGALRLNRADLGLVHERPRRSEERRSGNDGVMTGRSRWCPYHYIKTSITKIQYT